MAVVNKDIFRILDTDALIVADGGWVAGKHAFSTDNKEHLWKIGLDTFRGVDKTKILLLDGTNEMGGNLDLAGNSIIIDGDGDSKLTNPASNTLGLELGGSELFRWNTTGFGIGVTPTECFHILQDTTNLTVLLDASASDKLTSILMLGNPTGTNRYGELGWGLTPSGTLGSITARRGTGASTLDMIFSTNAGAGGIEAMRIDENQDIGIGTSTPEGILHTVKGTSANIFLIDTFSTTDATASTIRFRKGASNTKGTFTETVSDTFGTIEFFGADSGNTVGNASVVFKVTQDGASGAANVPGKLSIEMATSSASAFQVFELKNNALLTLGGSSAVTPKLDFSDGTNISSIELDSNDDLIIKSDGTDGAGIIFDTSSPSMTISANETPVAQNLYNLMIQWGAAGSPTNSNKVIGIDNATSADNDVGFAFLVNTVQYFTLQAEVNNAASDIDFVLYKGTGVTAAETVFKYDNDGISSTEGNFTFGNSSSLLCTEIVLSGNNDSDDTALTFRFNANDATAVNIGVIEFENKDSASNDTIYCTITGTIVDSTDASEDGRITISNLVAGSGTTIATFEAGLQIGTPTNGDKGVGTINAAGDIFKNDSAYTNPDYVLEHWVTGKIEKFKNNFGASEYAGLMPLNEVNFFIQENFKLPGIGDDPKGMFERGDIILEKLEEIFIHLINHENKINEVFKMLNK